MKLEKSTTSATNLFGIRLFYEKTYAVCRYVSKPHLLPYCYGLSNVTQRACYSFETSGFQVISHGAGYSWYTHIVWLFTDNRIERIQLSNILGYSSFGAFYSSVPLNSVFLGIRSWNGPETKCLGAAQRGKVLGLKN